MSSTFSGIPAYGISFTSGTAGKLGWSWTFMRPIGTLIAKSRLLGVDPREVRILASFGTSDFDFDPLRFNNPTIRDG